MSNKKYVRQQKQPKKKFCYIEKNKIATICYRDVELLSKFINSNQKINASRITGTKPKYQRQIAKAIKNAREMALLPYAK